MGFKVLLMAGRKRHFNFQFHYDEVYKLTFTFNPGYNIINYFYLSIY